MLLAKPVGRTTLPWRCYAPRQAFRSHNLVLLFFFSAFVHAQTLQIAVVEGGDAVHKAGTIAYKGITVEVRNGAQPAPNIPVTFLLPETAPTGVFPSGQRTETTRTDQQGRASVWGIRWGAYSGTVAMTITARSTDGSAGTMALLRVEGARAAPTATSAIGSFEVNPAPPPQSNPGQAPYPAAAVNSDGIAPPAPRRPAVVLTTSNDRIEPMPSSRSKWVIIGLGIAGAVGGGLAYKMTHNQAGSSAAPTPTTPALVLSAPTFTIGKP